MAPVTRRQLLELGLKLTGAATVLGLAGTACGPTNEMPDAGDDHGHDAGGGTPDAGETTPDAGDATVDAGEQQACADGAGGTISANHGHAVTITLEHLELQGDGEFVIKGTSSHGHKITVLNTHKETLLAGGTVTLTSTTDFDHSHEVTLRCA